MPAQREFRAGAHQALLAANGRDTFYTPEIQRAIAGAGSPLDRFLPAANYEITPRGTGANPGGAHVAFKLETAQIESARPLRSTQSQPGALALPRTEIDAFALATRQFLAPAVGITPLQQQCRREFRLPDPIREPDAYWVVGSGFDRRLLILWGCERFARTSVPLDRVVEHLRTCEMAWEDKQQLAVQLAIRKEEPISRFLARPAKGEEGGFTIRDNSVSAKSVKPFVNFSNDAWRNFDTAARAFIQHADEANVPPFEAELRREFRLPSLAAAPSRFHRYGSHVLVDISPLDRAQCVPPAPISGDKTDSTLQPLNEQLRKRIKFQGTPYLIAAGVVALLSLIAGAFWMFGPDRTPPSFIELQLVSPRRLAVLFNEPISAEIPAGAVAFVDDKRKITSASPDPLKPQRLLIELNPETPMIDGDTYGLVLAETVVDRSGNPLTYTSEKFTFFDPVAPELIPGPTRISAGGKSNHDLVLTFTKPIDKDSLDGSGFLITPISGGQPGKRVPIKEAKLDPDIKEDTRVIVTADEPFESRLKYSLSITRGVTDRAEKPNRAKIENLEFEYIDLLPPSVRKIVEAKAATYRIQIEFSKPLDRTTALDVANYVIERPGSTKASPLLQPISTGGATLDETGRFVTLSLERGLLVTGKHKLIILRSADDKGNITERATERDFDYDDVSQRGIPKFAEVRASAGVRIELLFDRSLAPAPVAKERFRILNAERQPADLTVSSASLSPDDGRKVLLTLSRAPTGGLAYHVRSEGLEDVFGSRQDTPEISAPFRAVGVPRPAPLLTLKNKPKFISDRQILITLDDVATRESAENISNYSMRPVGTPAPQNARLEVVKNTDGTNSSTVTLTFAAPLTAPIDVGMNSLQFENDPTNSLNKILPVRVDVAN
jgi:hypothetical protein